MNHKSVKTYWAKIYMSGPIEVAKQIIRLSAARKGLCVTIEPTSYIYSFGEEAGYVIGFINYPKFPVKKHSIKRRALNLAEEIRAATGQKTFLFMDSKVTSWFS